MVAGAAAHPVALDTVEVLGTDQWLALLILGDLDPYTPLTTPRPSYPGPHRIDEEPLIQLPSDLSR